MNDLPASPRVARRAALTVLLGCHALPIATRAEELGLTEAVEVFAPDGSAGDAFGSSVAADGERVVIGAIGDDDGGSFSGSAYVFLRTATGLVLEAKLVAPDGANNDRFGYAVAIEGERLAVGAIGDQDAGVDTGAVYVYSRATGTWLFETKLVPADARPGEQFGNAIGIAADRLAAGAHRQSVAGSDSGAVYVFARDTAGWHEEVKLVPFDAHAYDQFGFSLSISGERLIAGAYHDDDLGSSSGAAYVYVRTGSAWTLEAKLLQDDGIAFDELGYSVSLDGDTAIVGAHGADELGLSSGAAYVFHRDGSQWMQTAKLLAPGGGVQDFFGEQLVLDDRWAAVASPRDDSAAPNGGAVHLFERCGTHWLARAELSASDAVASALLGDAPAIALDGGELFVGAPSDDELAMNAGSLYVFGEAQFPYTTYCFGDGSGTACPCGNASAAGAGEGCRHSLDSGGRIVPLGTTSVGLDDLLVHLCQIPPLRPAMLIAGLVPVNGGAGEPFGDGLLCVSGARAIVGLVLTDAAGTAWFGPGLAAREGFGAGDLRYFQARFRDPLGGPCGHAFNTTPAIAVSFVP